jgi:hypothetical protein
VIKVIAVAAFLAGLLLAMRVMFFGVQRRQGFEVLYHRKWPLALAAFLVVVGAMLYLGASSPSARWVTVVVGSGLLAGAAAWFLVAKSATIGSSDPEDDPKYRFQGHVARVTSPIVATSGTGAPLGRISFDFDGERYGFDARWAPEADLVGGSLATAGVDTEVVIEYVDGDVAYVEPWVVVEKRL